MAAEITCEVLRAPLVIEYPFRRTTGPVIGAFFTAVREGRLLGIKAADGSVICPPQEYDPVTAEPLTELVPVGDTGTVESWTWVTSLVRASHLIGRSPGRWCAWTAPTHR